MARKAKAAAVAEVLPLTGKALLQKLKEIPHLSRREKARECGYYTVVGDDEIRVRSGEFMNAVLSAKGISLEDTSSKAVRGRTVSFRAVVQKNGILLLGAAYTQIMGLKPGDEFEIKPGRKQIRLVQVSTDDSESEAE